MVVCPETGIGVQPRCCGGGTTPCSRCVGSKAPLYWEIVLTGIFDKSPTDCPACPRYNSATFTVKPPPAEECLPLSGYEGISDETPCCWICYINSNQMECNFPPGAPNVIELLIAETGGDYYINVFLDDKTAGADREVYFRKQYAELPDCRNLIGEDIPWFSNGPSGMCGGDALSTCTITAKTSVVDPCCRGTCYPDETPGPLTIVVAGLSGGDCPCTSLNGTYVLTRSDRSGVGCWRARFPEVCGMNAIAAGMGPGSEVVFYNADTYPLGNILTFTSSHYFPFSSFFTFPYADCNQFNGMEFRTSGDGICSVPGSPGYATATMTF